MLFIMIIIYKLFLNLDIPIVINYILLSIILISLLLCLLVK